MGMKSTPLGGFSTYENWTSMYRKEIPSIWTFRRRRVFGEALDVLSVKGCINQEGGNLKFITIMYVERTFGILKGWWRLIMKQSEIPLKNMLDIVATCIILYNLYILNDAKIDKTIL